MIEFVDLEKALSDLASQARDRSSALWAMGDILERVFRTVESSERARREFARQGVSMSRFASALGLSTSKLSALRLTSAMFAPKDRNYDLSWEHHHAIARQFRHDTAAVRRKWLREAVKQEWSLNQLRARLRGRRPQILVAEARVERLRRQLASAEAQLDSLMEASGATR
jgi:hypothetical protein